MQGKYDICTPLELVSMVIEMMRTKDVRGFCYKNGGDYLASSSTKITNNFEGHADKFVLYCDFLYFGRGKVLRRRVRCCGTFVPDRICKSSNLEQYAMEIYSTKM